MKKALKEILVKQHETLKFPKLTRDDLKEVILLAVSDPIIRQKISEL